MKTLTTIIAAVIIFSVTSLSAISSPSGDAMNQAIMKKEIDRHLDYNGTAQHLNAEGTVEITVKVNNQNQLQVSYIDGNADLSEYVQANLENIKLGLQMNEGDSYNFKLKFAK